MQGTVPKGLYTLHIFIRYVFIYLLCLVLKLVEYRTELLDVISIPGKITLSQLVLRFIEIVSSLLYELLNWCHFYRDFFSNSFLSFRFDNRRQSEGLVQCILECKTERNFILITDNNPLQFRELALFCP
jgi:hypothetical protein